MDKICKAYVSQVRTMLPVWGKKEKAFIKKLREDLTDYCEENNIATIGELYKGYGKPQDVAFEYITIMEPEVISKRINTAKYIRVLVAVLIALAIIATSAFCAYLCIEYQSNARQEVVISDTIRRIS